MPQRCQNIREELVRAIHFLHAQGWAPATSSNYSCRQGRDIWISASGLEKGDFRQEDLIRVNLQGHPMGDRRKTSAETLLHVLIYELFPETSCILHTHSILNNVLSKAHLPEGEIRFEENELQKAIRGISSHKSPVLLPIFENSQDMEALASKIRARLNGAPEPFGFLLAAHGLYAWGRSVAETRRHIEAFEFLLSYRYHLKTYTS